MVDRDGNKNPRSTTKSLFFSSDVPRHMNRPDWPIFLIWRTLRESRAGARERRRRRQRLLGLRDVTTMRYGQLGALRYLHRRIYFEVPEEALRTNLSTLILDTA